MKLSAASCTIWVMSNAPLSRQREEKALDKTVQRILGWDGLHNFVSTPLWINTMLNALPDAIMLARLDDEWVATVGDTSVEGWSLPVVLGRMIYALSVEGDN